MIPQPNPQRWPGPCYEEQALNYNPAAPTTISISLSAQAADDFGTTASGGASQVYTRNTDIVCATSMPKPADNTFALCQYLYCCASPPNPSFVLGNSTNTGSWSCSATGKDGSYSGNWDLGVGIILEGDGTYTIEGNAEPIVTGSPAPVPPDPDPWINYCWNGLGFGFGASGLSLAELIGTHTFSNYVNPTFYSDVTLVIL